ncbi:hypothetical protein [Hasllibacter sp. MH4015]|uniref:hypothetical protein n=1 Tax=Hasllibacter sp. MH4015 TaxID=2854029 RepID=UPI001CD5F279|nr:hypothetical protein [Hasllibacter sp. MH4015]
MVLTDEGALIILAILAGIALALAAIVALGVFLARRGYRVVGIVMVGAVAAVFVVPVVLNQLRLAQVRSAIAGATIAPETLSLTGRRVLFIGNAGTLCDEICGMAVALGIEMEADWLPIGGYAEVGPEEHPLLGLVERPGDVRGITLGPPSGSDNRRYPRQRDAPYGPPYDIVILSDRSGLLTYFAPDYLGVTLPGAANAQIATMMFEDWPDPLAAPPPGDAPMPVYRTIAAWVTLIRPWAPFGANTPFVPGVLATEQPWIDALCAEAGAEEARDAFTFRLRCTDAW